MFRPMAYTGGTPHNTLNFTRVEHLYKRTTVYLRPAYKLSFTQQINHTASNKDSQIKRLITVINAKNIQIIRFI